MNIVTFAVTIGVLVVCGIVAMRRGSPLLVSKKNREALTAKSSELISRLDQQPKQQWFADINPENINSEKTKPKE